MKLSKDGDLTALIISSAIITAILFAQIVSGGDLFLNAFGIGVLWAVVAIICCSVKKDEEKQDELKDKQSVNNEYKTIEYEEYKKYKRNLKNKTASYPAFGLFYFISLLMSIIVAVGGLWFECLITLITFIIIAIVLHFIKFQLNQQIKEFELKLPSFIEQSGVIDILKQEKLQEEAQQKQILINSLTKELERYALIKTDYALRRISELKNEYEILIMELDNLNTELSQINTSELAWEVYFDYFYKIDYTNPTQDLAPLYTIALLAFLK